MNDQTDTTCNDTTIAQQSASTAQHGATPAQQSASLAQQSATVVAPPDSAATPDDADACSQTDDPARNNCSANLLHLTEAQELALEQLIVGRRDSDVAKALKVNRGTIYRWRTRHPRFIAELSYRAQAARLESSLNAQAALGLATQLVLQRLRSKPRRSMRLAMRLLTSARMSHLATPRHQPIRQVLSDLYQVRYADPEPPFDNKPCFARLEKQEGMLSELATELSSPLPTPKPRRKPALRIFTPSEMHKNQANRKPRQDLLDAMNMYPNIIPPDVAAIVARRPNLAPLDIHSVMLDPQYQGDNRLPRVLAEMTPEGTWAPFDPEIIEKLAAKGLIQSIAGHRLADYEVLRRGSEIHLYPHPSGEPLILAAIWRDDLLTTK